MPKRVLTEAEKERKRVHQRNRSAAARERGDCIVCCTRPAQDGKTLCAQCQDRTAQWDTSNRPRRRELDRNRVAKFVAAGICPRCRTNDIKPGTQWCMPCQRAHYIRQRERLASIGYKVKRLWRAVVRIMLN